MDHFKTKLSNLLTLSNPSLWFDGLIILYLYWVAFEWTIVSRIPSYTLIQYVRNAMDIIPLVLLVISMVILNPKFRDSELKILLGFLTIVIVSVFSLLLESRNPSTVAEYIGVTVRFVPLIVLIRFTTPDFKETLFGHIKIVYWILAGLALLNLLGKEWFNGIFLPPSGVFGEVLPTTYTDPGISATFINTVEFSFFLVALTVFYLYNETNPRTRLLVSLISLVLTVLSFSIASVLGLLLVFYLRSTRKLLMALLMVGLLVMGIWFFNDFFLLLLGMDLKYWIEISSEFNRLGYITKVFPEFLHGGLKDLIFGMGYDAHLVDLKLGNYHNTPWVMINNENNLKYLKDVYWLSILIAQGLISLLVTGYIFVTLWFSAKRERSEKNFRLVKTFILLALFLGLFNQVMDLKAFTYCFWLMAGIALLKPQVQTEIAFA